MKLAALVCGIVLVLVTLLDVYLTVLYSRSGKGLYSPRVYSAVWRLFRQFGHLPWKATKQLEHCGPILLVLWACLLWLGFYQMLMALEAMLGFSVLTLSLTYFVGLHGVDRAQQLRDEFASRHRWHR